ncbi:MAG: LacI family DNA-binding transcriptional regulator [Candidatus Omnitrophota bacterium]
MEKKLEDIARELNLSIATVSRALNNHTEKLVKKTTRDRIFEFIKKSGYKPNIKARGLAQGKLTNFFLILSQNEASIFYDYYFMNVIRGIHTVIIDSEYSLVMLPVRNDYTEEQIYKILLDNETAGLILSPYCSCIEFPFDVIQGYPFPIVSLDNEIKARNSCSIMLDHTSAGYKGAKFLWEKNYRNFLIISDKRRSPHSAMRKKGFYSFLKDKEPGTYTIQEIDLILSYTSGLSAIEKVIKINNYPIGVFALNDEIAVSIINHAWEKGIQVPRQMGVLGFDGLPIGKHVYPQLCSVGFPFYDIGKMAAQSLLEQISGEVRNVKKIVQAVVTEGFSC